MSMSIGKFLISSAILWKVMCIKVAILSLISFGLLCYLKLTGEVMPFSFYDNFFYCFYYFALFLYSFVVYDLGNVPITKSRCRFWYSNKMLACMIICVEIEALAQFCLNHGQISYELDIDEAAMPFIYGLFGLGIMRLLLISIINSIGFHQLNSTIQNRSYHPDTFGSTFTFCSDFIIIQLYLFTAYLYDFRMQIILLISSVSYVYYKHIRV